MIDTRKAIIPVIQVLARFPRQAAIRNLPTMCENRNTKKSCTDQKCTLLNQCPRLEMWYQDGPANASTTPDRTIIASETSVRTPKT